MAVKNNSRAVPQKNASARLEEALNKGNQGIKEKFSKAFSSKALAQFVGINAKSAEVIYSQAYRHYTNGKYDKASDLFELLILYNGEDPRFTMGLASCYHMKKNYESAIQLYASAGLLEPENPLPHYHASDCYLQVGDKMSAVIALQMAVKRAGDKEEYAIIKDRAIMAIEKYKHDLMSSVQL